MISRPMKAPGESITDKQLETIEYPVAGSPKIDGIRALKGPGVLLSSTLKPIGNKYIQKCLASDEYNGLDGELAVGSPFRDMEDDDDDVFHRTSGPVRRGSGEPNFKLYCFDDFTEKLKSYQYRWLDQIAEYPEISEIPHLVIVEQKILTCPQDVIDYEAWCMNAGYEGAMIRRLTAPYKEGRATFREEFIFKRKPIEDDEAEIIGFVEQMENKNEKIITELGTSRRSGHKENKVGKNTLGKFICKSKKWKDPFNCGTIRGFHADFCKHEKVTTTTEFRKYVWEHQDEFLNMIIKYDYQNIGSIDKPRQPRMKGFRDLSDITDY